MWGLRLESQRDLLDLIGIITKIAGYCMAYRGCLVGLQFGLHGLRSENLAIHAVSVRGLGL